MPDLKTLFADPPARYRGAPFWSWNDRLQVEELVRQVDDMVAHGMGGFFMHSRDGLETVYMGEEWMTCVRETVQAAKEAGVYAWLYDEDRWPSGAAGGLVPARGGDAFRAKAVTIERALSFRPEQAHGDVLALFRAQIEGEGLLETTRVSSDAPHEAAPGEVLLVFRRTIAAPSEWFNDDAPADNLNPDAVAAFVDITYEAYRREVGDEFGKTVPGIFTDEPNFGCDRVAGSLPRIPWTDGLDTYFAERRGYDLIDVLPYVFLEGDRSAQARHDYWWTISERFTETFSKQVGEWCETHGLAFTGHYLLENTMGDAIVSAGSVMPHYRYQHVPGIDMLTIQTDENLTVKQCSSVAHQLGGKPVLSELYGCAGWEMTFEDEKWSGDWQYVLGVSLRCQHLALYSLRGCRKRDYPPSFSYNTTWWKYNRTVEDYFARVGLLTTQGRAVRDVLVLHPISTAWTMVADGQRNASSVARANAFGETVNAFTRAILATHYDFDLGDEQIMADLGRVETGTLWVSRATYKAVVVPPGTRTLLASTVELLGRFLHAGGTVIAFDPLPAMVEAVADTRAAVLFRHPGAIVLQDVCEIEAALERAVPRRVSICGTHGQQAPSLLYTQREAGEKRIFFLVNSDRDSAHHVRVGLEGTGALEEWDLLTGEVTAVPGEAREGKVWIETDFAPAGSRMYVLDSSLQAPAASPLLSTVPGHPVPVAYVGPVCRFRRTDPNVLTLDVCRYRIEDGEWSAALPVWQAQRAVRNTLGMRNVYYNGLPQRYKWVHEPHPRDGTAVAFEFVFDVPDVPQTPVLLLVEGAQDYDISLNDEPVPSESIGWYLDRSFDKVTLPALKRGPNALTLYSAYENRMEVEDCYLLGDFCVDVSRAIVSEPETIRFGDWCLQGYLHYAGGIIYQDNLVYDPDAHGRLRLTLGETAAVTVAIWVNGQVVGHIPWRAANGFDLTPHLHLGENDIGIEVVGSPRNMLGPLHRKRGREPGTSWRSFRLEGPEYTPDYVLRPYGLFGQVHIVSQR